MSTNFSANQFEPAFYPHRLQNFQVPAKHRERPSKRSGCTQIISNERGHLKPNIPRSLASPWGSFMGTWQVERKPIQLKTRTKLMNKLAQIDRDQEGMHSKHSSRAASARLSRGSLGSQIEPATAISPRPHSTEGNQRGEQLASTPADSSPSPKPPTAGSEEPESRASTATSEREASHSRSGTTPLAHRSIATQTKTPPSTSSAQSSPEPHTHSPSDTRTRSASATYTRSSNLTTSCSLPSRGQSATTRSSLQPPATASLSSHSRVSSAAASSSHHGAGEDSGGGGTGSEMARTPQPAPLVSSSSTPQQ